MAPGRFRALAARMDAVLVERLGDRAIREDGTDLFGTFVSPFISGELSGGSHRIGAVANAEDVQQPTFTARVIDTVGFKKGTPLIVDLPPVYGGGAYVVVQLKPDGSGMVDVILRPGNERIQDPA